MTTRPARQHPLRKFLIRYGDSNELWFCDAQDRDHAVEQFEDAEMAGTVTEVFECVPAMNRYFVRQRRPMWVCYVQEVEAEDCDAAIDSFYDEFDPQHSFIEKALQRADHGPATAFDRRDYPTPQDVVEAD